MSKQTFTPRQQPGRSSFQAGFATDGRGQKNPQSAISNNIRGTCHKLALGGRSGTCKFVCDARDRRNRQATATRANHRLQPSPGSGKAANGPKSSSLCTRRPPRTNRQMGKRQRRLRARRREPREALPATSRSTNANSGCQSSRRTRRTNDPRAARTPPPRSSRNRRRDCARRLVAPHSPLAANPHRRRNRRAARARRRHKTTHLRIGRCRTLRYKIGLMTDTSEIAVVNPGLQQVRFSTLSKRSRPRLSCRHSVRRSTTYLRPAESRAGIGGRDFPPAHRNA